jgi:hypothetical protein
MVKQIGSLVPRLDDSCSHSSPTVSMLETFCGNVFFLLSNLSETIHQSSILPHSLSARDGLLSIPPLPTSSAVNGLKGDVSAGATYLA